MGTTVYRVVFLVVCLVGLAACAPGSFYRSPDLNELRDRVVVLMPLDLELGEIQAGGLIEPKAEWTDTARLLLTEAIEQTMRARNAKLALASRDPKLDNPDDPEVQLVKLHAAVGSSAVLHYFGPHYKLPSKGERFDWTLGPEVMSLRNRYGADYALFVYMRDNYVSAGRVAVIIVAAALGVGIPGGHQVGFASLVDLRTGDIVWINRMIRPGGDLRKEPGAVDTAAHLLTEFPK